MVSAELIKLCIVAFGMIAFDVLTGILSAFINGSFKSSIMRQGGLHKLMLVVAICFGIFLDKSLAMVDIGISIPVGSGICIYIILMEACSVIENINSGFPGAIPSSVIKLFNTAKDEAEKSN